MIYENIYAKTNQKIPFKTFPAQQYLPFSHPKFATSIIHEGQLPDPIHGSINVPIYLSSTFAMKDICELYSQFDYSRCGVNPTRSALEKVMTSIEYSDYALAFSSSFGAITAILHLLKTGDHLIVCDEVQRGKRQLISSFCKKHQIEYGFSDMFAIANINQLIQSNTQMIWIQTPTFTTLKIIDIKSIAQLTKMRKILTVCDNSLANPYLQSPIMLGIDISLNDASFIAGHSDINMGLIVFNTYDLYERLFIIAESIGACPSALDSYLCLRGIKTLEIRSIQICKNAFILAHFLKNHSAVREVLYPGLKQHPQHNIARNQMRGFGGVISIILKGDEKQILRFLKKLKIFTIGDSIGGVQSFASNPTLMAQGSTGLQLRNLVKLSVGIEDIQDLVSDVNEALSQVMG